MLLKLVKLAIITIFSAALQFLATQYAYIERGYQAVGGEVFVFPLCMIIGAMIFGLFREENGSVDRDEESEDYFYDEDDFDQWVS